MAQEQGKGPLQSGLLLLPSSSNLRRRGADKLADDAGIRVADVEGVAVAADGDSVGPRELQARAQGQGLRARPVSTAPPAWLARAGAGCIREGRRYPAALPPFTIACWPDEPGSQQSLVLSPHCPAQAPPPSPQPTPAGWCAPRTWPSWSPCSPIFIL